MPRSRHSSRPDFGPLRFFFLLGVCAFILPLHSAACKQLGGNAGRRPEPRLPVRGIGPRVSDERADADGRAVPYYEACSFYDLAQAGDLGRIRECLF